METKRFSLDDPYGSAPVTPPFVQAVSTAAPWNNMPVTRDYTLGQILDQTIARCGPQDCLVYADRDYRLSWYEFGGLVDQFACGLMALGVQRGEKIALWATNVPLWIPLMFAAAKIGAVLLPLNTSYRSTELDFALRQSETENLFLINGVRDTDYVQTVYDLVPELKTQPRGALRSAAYPHLRRVFFLGPEKHRGMYSINELQALAVQTPRTDYEARQRGLDCRDIVNMQYTSGTTGFPKGVMLTHYNVVNNGKAIGDCMDLSTADRMMIQVPMFHCFGMVLSMTAAMTHGTTMSPIPAFSPSKGLDCISREKITCFQGVPTMFIAMLGHKDFPTTDFSHVRTGIMAGSPCPIKVMEEVVEKMNMSEICITYGQTESSPATTMSKTTDSLDVRVNTVGAAMFAVECKIVDPETGLECPDGVDGEFCARGYNIMKGYYKMPAATAAAIDRDGFLHSGDLARRTPEGYFKITGRIKDMIIRGGENIYPKEIEDFLYTHPKIEDVQVIGVPDRDYGEEIMACVVLKKGETATEDEIKEYVRSHMAKHKTPRYVDFVDSFPMNAAGKILKYKMREDAVKKLNLQAANAIETA